MEKTKAQQLGQRIVVVGQSGSGKSTLAAQIANRLDLPLVDVDAFAWGPAWQLASELEIAERLEAAIAADGWVVAGTLEGAAGALLMRNGDTVVWLDLPLVMVSWRILRRSWVRWQSKTVVWGGNMESFWWQLALWNRHALLRLVWATHRKMRRKHLSLMAGSQCSNARWIQLRSAAEVRDFVHSLERDGAGE